MAFEDTLATLAEMSSYSDGTENSNAIGAAASKQNFNFFEFKFTIVNGDSSNDRKIAINPAFFDITKVTTVTTAAGSPLAYTSTSTVAFNNITNITNAGHSDVYSILDDGTPATNITVTADDKKCRDLLNFVKFNQCLISEIQIEADNKAQWNQQLIVRQVSPFMSTGDALKVSMNRYYKPDTYDNTKIVMPLLKEGKVVQMDNQSLILMGIGKSRSISVTLSIVVLNNDSANVFQAVKTVVK